MRGKLIEVEKGYAQSVGHICDSDGAAHWGKRGRMVEFILQFSEPTDHRIYENPNYRFFSAEGKAREWFSNESNES